MVLLSSFSQWIFLYTVSARLWEIPPYSWRVHINSKLYLTSQKLKVLSVMQFIKATSFRHVTSLHSKDTILDIPDAPSSGFRTHMHSNRRSVSWLKVLQWILVPQTDRLEPVSKTFAAKLVSRPNESSQCALFMQELHYVLNMITVQQRKVLSIDWSIPSISDSPLLLSWNEYLLVHGTERESRFTHSKVTQFMTVTRNFARWRARPTHALYLKRSSTKTHEVVLTN
jgi:hypothetical protein